MLARRVLLDANLLMRCQGAPMQIRRRRGASISQPFTARDFAQVPPRLRYYRRGFARPSHTKKFRRLCHAAAFLRRQLRSGPVSLQGRRYTNDISCRAAEYHGIARQSAASRPPRCRTPGFTPMSAHDSTISRAHRPRRRRIADCSPGRWHDRLSITSSGTRSHAW